MSPRRRPDWLETEEKSVRGGKGGKILRQKPKKKRVRGEACFSKRKKKAGTDRAVKNKRSSIRLGEGGGEGKLGAAIKCELQKYKRKGDGRLVANRRGKKLQQKKNVQGKAQRGSQNHSKHEGGGDGKEKKISNIQKEVARNSGGGEKK